MVQGTFILFFTSPKTDGTVHRIKNLAFFSITMITRKVKIT